MKGIRILWLLAIGLMFTIGPLAADQTPTPTCGDLDNSDSIDLSDAIHLFEYIFGQQPPLPDPSVADVNCDGKIDISDVTYLLAYIFYGGAEPCADCPPENSTQIVGTLTLAAGQSGDLAGTKVYIYKTVTDWNLFNPTMSVVAVGSGSTVTYLIDSVSPGTWFLDAWKSDSGWNFWTSGDIVGWYGSGSLGAPSLSAFSVTPGETKVINVDNMTVIP